MEKKTYEPHFFADPAFPIIFHYDVAPQDNIFPPHWHENLEILYFTHGAASVGINTETFSVSEGEIAIVPSNALHIVQSISDLCRYYCLIVDRDFCANFGFKLDEICFAKKISDPHLNRKMDVIVHEFKDKKDFYQSEILSAIISMIVYLARHHLSSATQTLSKVETSRLEMVKCAFLYIEQNYEKDLTVDQISAHAGFNKYYFCHVFKSITGMTPIHYINYVRCRKAKELLASGRCNVGEAAVQCGFENVSYFTKTFKKYVGELPSKIMP